MIAGLLIVTAWFFVAVVAARSSRFDLPAVEDSDLPFADDEAERHSCTDRLYIDAIELRVDGDPRKRWRALSRVTPAVDGRRPDWDIPADYFRKARSLYVAAPKVRDHSDEQRKMHMKVEISDASGHLLAAPAALVSAPRTEPNGDGCGFVYRGRAVLSSSTGELRGLME